MSLTCQRLGGALGAVVEGIDVAGCPDSAIRGVEEALAAHSLLLFREQDLTASGIVAFLDRFSETMTPWNLTPQHMSQDNPKAMVISSAGARYAGSTWHADYSFIENPADYSAFYMSAVPNVGGNTAFANMYRAYDALSVPMKVMLDGLKAVHDNAHRHDRQYDGGEGYMPKDSYAKLPPVAHPLIRTNPATGRKAIYFGAAVTKAVVGLPFLESRAIIDFLTDHCARLEFSYRHDWRAGDLILWDNRCVIHCAVSDYDVSETREGLIVCSRERF